MPLVRPSESLLEDRSPSQRPVHMSRLLVLALLLALTVGWAGPAAGDTAGTQAGKTVVCREYGPLQIEVGVWTRKGRKEYFAAAWSPGASRTGGLAVFGRATPATINTDANCRRLQANAAGSPATLDQPIRYRRTELRHVLLRVRRWAPPGGESAASARSRMVRRGRAAQRPRRRRHRTAAGPRPPVPLRAGGQGRRPRSPARRRERSRRPAATSASARRRTRGSSPWPD